MVAIIHDMQQFHILFVAYLFTSIMICFKVMGTFSGEETLSFSFLPPMLLGSTLKDRGPVVQN